MQANKKELFDKLNYSGIFAVIILCCLGIIIYSNTFYSPFQFDDEDSIVKNFSIRNLSVPKAIWNFWPTRFITYLSLALNYRFSRLNTFGYHFFNLTVHLISAILVWWLVLLTFSTPVMKDQKITQQANHIAFFVGLVFLSHPIQTQAVTYIIQRTTSLAVLFYLASLSLYVKSRLLQQKGQSIYRPYYIYSLIFAVLAMFTKEMTITLPLMILLYEFCFLKTEKGIKAKQLIPFLVTLLIIPLTMLLTKSVNFGEMRRVTEPGSNISVSHYILTQFRVMVTYLRLLFIPLNQNLDYDYPISHSLWQLPTLASLLLLVTIVIIAIRLFSRYKLTSFAIFWFFLTLFPESTIVPIRDVIFEHRLYLPMVGFGLFVVSIIYYLSRINTFRSLITLLFIIVICYSTLTYNRNFIWEDELTLWNDTVHKSPQKPRPYNNRGLAYQSRGNLKQAFADYNRAIQIDPNYADAYANRGIAYAAQGSFNQALADFNKAIQIRPNLVQAYNSRGNVYATQGSFNQALADYNQAIQINPNYADAYNNRGNIYIAQGNFGRALSDFNQAIQINPNYADAYNNRGNVYAAQGSFSQALADYNQAIQINPYYANAYNNRGLAYQSRGNFSQALADYNQAIQINPNYANAYNNRAIIYFYKKEYDKSWDDVHKVESLGGKVDPHFLEDLKKVSGRKK